MKPLYIEVGAGELIDKITILQIKSERISDPQKLKNIHHELKALSEVAVSLPTSYELTRLTAALKEINAKLWDIEEGKRASERNQEFGDHFTQLARRVYLDNDQRAALKKQINILVQSTVIEEKSY